MSAARILLAADPGSSGCPRAVGACLVLVAMGAPSGCRRVDAPRDRGAPGASASVEERSSLASGSGSSQTSPPSAPTEIPPPDLDALPAASGLPPERRALQVVYGEERVVDAQAAVAAGQTLVDLSDDWAPTIFADATAPDGAPLPNRYRPVFVGLANDRTDGDGQALSATERNHLELYGIPPSLSVLQRRFLADGPRICDTTVDNARLLAVDAIETWGASTEKKELARARARATRLEAARAKAEVATLGELSVAQPRLAKEIRAAERFAAERLAFAEVEKRLVCEGLMESARHAAGSYDTPMRLAVLAFQQRNVVMAQGDLTRGTLEAMARPILENDLRALVRVLEERAVHAGGLLEDGSVDPPPGSTRKPPTYKNAAGERVPVPNLVRAATEALLERLGVSTPAQALAFFQRRRPEDFRWLRVAVRLPARPEYYGPRMDLSAEIDRGDVWYDFPFDVKGERVPQPRKRFPSFTLFVRWRGERVPLVRWRTTIGGWRSELAGDGEEYLRYKGSDVGPRVWRHIVAGPVWIPPPSTPLGGMVKRKWINGRNERVTNYDEVGPGYLSAYGLVAGIHVDMRKRESGATYFDNGIRTHGTFDYLSLRGRFSHGCHRLQNNLAVRLYSFVIERRAHRVLGQMALNSRRTFYQDGEVFDMRLPTRGFYYELDPPLPVETLEGEVQGVAKKAPPGYVRKPGVEYSTLTVPAAPGGVESKAGGGGAEP
jgi:hypothetical protein